MFHTVVHTHSKGRDDDRLGRNVGISTHASNEIHIDSFDRLFHLTWGNG